MNEDTTLLGSSHGSQTPGALPGAFGSAGGILLDGQQPAPATSAPATQSAPPEDDEIAERARAWYVEAMEHPLWQNWKRESDEDMGFYIGGKLQWSKDGTFDDWDELVANERTVLSINHIQAVVDVMTGYAIQNRSDMKAAPQGDQDDEDARILTWLMKFEQDQTQMANRLIDSFEDGVITGMDATKYTIDHLAGKRPRIDVRRVRPGVELMWDPFWTEYDGSDCRYMLEFRWGFVLDIANEFAEQKDQILAAVGELHGAVAGAQRTTGKSSGDNYGSVRNHPIENVAHESYFYDPRDRRLLLLEVWYRVYETEWVVVDQDTGAIEIEHDPDGKPLTQALAQSLAAGDPTHLKAKGIPVRKVRMSTIIPATYQVLERHRNPHPNDDDHYPYALYIAKRKRDYIYGIVRNMKDPQRVENKRWSQVLDILSRFANMRLLIPKGAMPHPEKIDVNDDSPLVWDSQATGEHKPEFLVPPLGALAQVLTELALQMKVNMREVSGINTDLLGLGTDTRSGVAIARRQAQGQVIGTLFYEHFAWTRKYAAQRLARRIQQTYTADQVVRLTDETGQPVLVSIAPKELRNAKGKDEISAIRQQLMEAGKPHILRDPSALKYDVVLVEAPSTPTARSLALASLLDILKVAPNLVPIVMDVIIELADIPERPKILQRVQALMQAATAGGSIGGPGKTPSPSPGPPSGPPPPVSAPPPPPQAPANAVAAGAAP